MFDINAEELWAKFGGMLIEYAPKFVLGLVVFYFGFKLINKSMSLLDKIMRSNKFDEDLRPFIITLLGLLLKLVVSISAIDLLGIETTSFVAMLAAAGFAVGLALQGSLSNFASGILILFFKPFRTGDMISIGDNIGIVQEIQIFNTILKTIHRRLIVIPNSILTSEIVENITGAGIIRVDLTFGIGYEDDIDKAREVIWSVIKGCPFLVHQEGQEHQVLVEKLNDSSVDLAVWVWTRGTDYWEAFYFMQEYVKKAFDKEGISIPFPQMDVHMKQ
ncbi:mechanosensitive ion channel family protein [Aureispira anguillae]|uniref:Mechanosensitive ion channel n=1 Tax=Aureispira anguillae TaxID=2864201 RepID=A0A915YF03_9BACT|nr:mechanosensitive ion channel domain-containing protein [Aureispira anguillae]BDS11908.1 mechanosensitive ion channel [Aureispira anguillae]